ncbi:hypothetical protein DPMN_174511 [Dreissena polymorpha]|uniref:Uncharacterized protein n=1 Tax=Dreissena polymorpha TaxID=45954 RepID=A0A9D4E6F4_DREPO|nr:hypothetical protein DPMN_174511 [Dreissena polymorpha]
MCRWLKRRRGSGWLERRRESGWLVERKYVAATRTGEAERQESGNIRDLKEVAQMLSVLACF